MGRSVFEFFLTCRIRHSPSSTEVTQKRRHKQGGTRNPPWSQAELGPIWVTSSVRPPSSPELPRCVPPAAPSPTRQSSPGRRCESARPSRTMQPLCESPGGGGHMGSAPKQSHGNPSTKLARATSVNSGNKNGRLAIDPL